MMMIKFNKFERVAGLFVLSSLVGFVLISVSVAVKQGWFESKTTYTTVFKNADGVHPGSMVQIAGLKAGSVDDVELLANNQIQVQFSILSKFADKIRTDSKAQLIRPFVIGERVLEVTVGEPTAELHDPSLALVSHEALDIMNLLSGKEMGNHLELIGRVMENLRYMADAFMSKDRAQSFVEIFDRLGPLLQNMDTMSKEVTVLSRQASRNKNLQKVVAELAVTTKELNAFMPELKANAPAMAKDLNQLVKNLALMTEEFKVVLPALAEIAPELPHTTKRAVEALDQAVILMKAFQKSFLLRSNVAEVNEEEKKREQDSRAPAGQ